MTRPVDFDEWAQEIQEQVLDPMDESAFVVHMTADRMAYDNLDINYAVQLGAMILLDKPIIVVHVPGTYLPPKLVKIADTIIAGHPKDPGFDDRLKAALEHIK